MSKNALIAVVAVVFVAGAGWYFYSRQGGAMMAASDTNQSAQGSIKDLIARGSSKCTVTNSVENSESNGTVYVGNGKMRGDFTSVTKNPAMTVESHMISDGAFIYTWSDAMPQGVKVAVSAANTTGQPNASEGNQAEMYNAVVDYDCDSWSVDESKFEIPTDITFMDVSTMMQGGTTGEGNAGSMNPPSKSAQCNMCDSAPEPQRSQCREALQCR